MYLEVLLARKPLVLDNLNPVTIGVQQKGNVLHAPVCESLLPADILILKSLASSFEIVNRNTCFVSFRNHQLHANRLTNMAKALGLAVAVVVVKALVLLGTIVPCQLEKTLPVASILILTLGERLIAGIAKEVKVEASFTVLNGA
jgi:hypothetical protein